MKRILLFIIAIWFLGALPVTAKPKYDVWAYYQANRDSYWRHYKPNVGELGYDRQPNIHGFRSTPKKKETPLLFLNFFDNIFNGRGE